MYLCNLKQVEQTVGYLPLHIQQYVILLSILHELGYLIRYLPVDGTGKDFIVLIRSKNQDIILHNSINCSKIERYIIR